MTYDNYLNQNENAKGECILYVAQATLYMAAKLNEHIDVNMNFAYFEE